MSAVVLVQWSILACFTYLQHLLLTGNDSVLISLWHDGGLYSTEGPPVSHCCNKYAWGVLIRPLE